MRSDRQLTGWPDGFVDGCNYATYEPSICSREEAPSTALAQCRPEHASKLIARYNASCMNRRGPHLGLGFESTRPTFGERKGRRKRSGRCLCCLATHQ